MADNSRRWPRLDLALAVVLRIEDVDEAAMTLNVSREGLFLRTPTPRPVGTPVDVTVALGDGGSFHANGVVVHIVPDPDELAPPPPDRPRGMGVFLTSTTPEWLEFCERVERSRAAPRDQTPPLPPRSGRRQRSS